MAIVSSSYVMDAHTQKDGSRWVKETHTDSTGAAQTCLYKLPAGQGAVEAQARMDARVPYLNEQLAEAEAQGIVNGTEP